jgi:hypothetical protein
MMAFGAVGAAQAGSPFKQARSGPQPGCEALKGQGGAESGNPTARGEVSPILAHDRGASVATCADADVGDDASRISSAGCQPIPRRVRRRHPVHAKALLTSNAT